MPIQPATTATRDIISDILSRFLIDQELQIEHLTSLLDKVYNKYQLSQLDANGLNSMLNKSPDVAMMEQNQFLHLEPTGSKNILPFVTIQSSQNWLHFRIYALLTMLDEKSNLQTIAIRFETDEGGPVSGKKIGTHDFCHAQLCNWINKHVQVITPLWVPDSQPSIPLDADNQIGLVLCMLASLYGGKHVQSKFYEPADRNLLEHLNSVRALRRPVKAT